MWVFLSRTVINNHKVLWELLFCVYKVQIVQADNLGIITVTPNNVIVNDHLDCECIGGVMASVLS